ncbi:MAG TPA: hypothetical protein VK171_15165 [Fimbriimonas sp.]|nr:hypothetical protein [Fimbriimonas sp.]
MKEQLKTPLIVIAAIVAVALAVFMAIKSSGGGNLDQGQVKYTPGVPPWQETDPSKQGPGGAPGGGGPGAVAPSAPGTPPPSSGAGQNAPPGMGAPSLGSTP